MYSFRVFNRRITCRSAEERREAASQIESEASQIAQLFNTLAGLPEFVSKSDTSKYQISPIPVYRPPISPIKKSLTIIIHFYYLLEVTKISG